MTEPKNSDILLAIGNLQGDVKGIDKKLDTHHERMNNHSERLRTVEERQAWWAGGAAVGGALLSALARKIGLV